MSKEALLQKHKATYHSDFYTWAKDQAELMSEGRMEELDIENLIEEIDDMANLHRDKVMSLLERSVEHMAVLVWDNERKFPEKDLRGTLGTWLREIRKFRLQVIDALDDKPGIKDALRQSEIRMKIWKRGLDKAHNKASKMYDKEIDAVLKATPEYDASQPQWTMDEILGFHLDDHDRKRDTGIYLKTPLYPQAVWDAID